MGGGATPEPVALGAEKASWASHEEQASEQCSSRLLAMVLYSSNWNSDTRVEGVVIVVLVCGGAAMSLVMVTLMVVMVIMVTAVIVLMVTDQVFVTYKHFLFFTCKCFDASKVSA